KHDAQGFVEEIVASWVGFANGPEVDPGTRKPTTEWPIQKYLWSDFMVSPGDEVSYRVTPMIGPADAKGQMSRLPPGVLRSTSALRPAGMQPVSSIAVSSRANGSHVFYPRIILQRSSAR